MNTKKYTPLVALQQRALGALLEEAAALIAERVNVPVEVVKRDMWEYCVLSTRVTFDKGEVSFDVAKGSDTAETLAVKYFGYLDSGDAKTITAAWEAIYLSDAVGPTDLATQPQKPPDDPKN